MIHFAGKETVSEQSEQRETETQKEGHRQSHGHSDTDSVIGRQTERREEREIKIGRQNNHEDQSWREDPQKTQSYLEDL